MASATTAFPAGLPLSTSSGSERSNVEPVEEATFEEGGVSVYVSNLSSTVTESEIEQALKQFGRIKPDEVAIRVRQGSTMGLDAWHHIA